MAVLPLVITDRYLLKVLTFAGINALVVVGLALLFGHAGQVSLGHAAFVGIGAYACAFCDGRARLAVAARPSPLAGAVAGLGGLLLALPSLRLKGHYLAMATLGFGELMTLTFKEAEPVTGGVDGFGGIPFPSLGPIEVDDGRLALLARLGTRRRRPARHLQRHLARARAAPCAPCTAASWAPRRAASTSSASRCAPSS